MNSGTRKGSTIQIRVTPISHQVILTHHYERKFYYLNGIARKGPVSYIWRSAAERAFAHPFSLKLPERHIATGNRVEARLG